MNKKKSKARNILLLVGLVIFGIIWLKDNFSSVDLPLTDSSTEITEENSLQGDFPNVSLDVKTAPDEAQSSLTIDQLTAEHRVVDYVKKNGKLPAYYITKKEARSLGWQSTYRDLCDAAPGKAIGGDYFSDFEKNLPKKKGRKYYEADINYRCGKRNANRLIYSNDGLIFITKDHYKTFEER